MRGLRSFAYGMLAVLLAVTLNQTGFVPAAIGGLITVSLAGDVVGTYVIGLFADQWGRRRTLATLALLMAGTGLVFGLTTNAVLLSLAAFFGTLGTSASETAPFLPIEQAMLPQTTSPKNRTALFARYNLVASFAGALGALCAGLPDLLTSHGVPRLFGLHLFFGVYTAVALAVAALALSLSESTEVTMRSQTGTQRVWKRLLPRLSQSRGIVWKLTGLFSVDALAGGLVVQSLMVLFFHLRFGISLSLLALLFFGANICSALSFLIAAPIARRIGLLNTMVFTHLPSAFCCTSTGPSNALADGCPHAPGVYDGVGLPSGADCRSLSDLTRTQCRIGNQSGHLWSVLARTCSGSWTPVHPGRGSQGCL